MTLRAFAFAVSCIASSCGGASSTDRDSSEGRATSLVLITLDTTNPGALDVYGKDRGVTPNLARFAAESQVFDGARTVAPLTLPAHASMLTGLVPPRHGLRDNGLGALPDEATTLAEVASDAGLATAAFVSAAVLDSQFGTSQGFDRFDAPDGTGADVTDYMVERRAEETVERAQRWLAEVEPDRPFFLWIHLFDPHVPYDAPDEVVRRTQGNLYLAEVASMDAALGPLLDALPPREDCATIVVGDHGESLGRHGEPTHSLLVHDATMHVPLFVRWPDGNAAGTRSDAPVSVCDVFPTALHAMGLADEYDHDGVNLAQPPGAERCVYFESYAGYIAFGLAPLAGIADGRGKWIGGPDERVWNGTALPMDGPRQQPASQDDLDAERYRTALRSFLDRSRLIAAEIETGATAAMQALGYAGSGTLAQDLPSPLEPTGRPSVQNGLENALSTYEAIVAAGVGRRREAATTLRRLLGENPANVTAARTLAGMELEDGRADEAVRILERVDARGGAGPDSLSLLGEAYLRLGRKGAAQRVLDRALAMRPRDTQIVAKRARASR